MGRFRGRRASLKGGNFIIPVSDTVFIHTVKFSASNASHLLVFVTSQVAQYRALALAGPGLFISSLVKNTFLMNPICENVLKEAQAKQVA